MKRITLYLLLWSLIVISTVMVKKGSQSPCPHQFPSGETPAKFLSNYDGDTFRVNISGWPEIIGQNISVRIARIDAPEIKGKKPCERQRAQEAKKFLKNMLERDEYLVLKRIRRDKYFRILADVESGGQDVARLLLAKGYAVPYEGGAKASVNWCEKVGPKF